MLVYTANEIEHVSTIPNSKSKLPGAQPFPFLNVENLHHSDQAAVKARIQSIREEEKAKGLIPREVFIASRRQICGDPTTVEHLINVLRYLDVPFLLLLNEKTGWTEVYDLHAFGHERTLRACGNRPC